MRHLFVILGVFAALAPTLGPEAAAGEPGPDRRKAIEATIEDYLIRHPEVIERALRTLEARREAEEARAVQAALKAHRKELLDEPGTPIAGDVDGDVTLVEFFDYRCGVCRRVHPVVSRLVESDGGIRRVYMEWPILGPESVYASRAALASRAQGLYHAFHDALMETRGGLDKAGVLRAASRVGLDIAKLRRDMASPEITAIINRNFAIAEALRINGTPSFVIGDRVIRGGRDAATMKRLVAQARAANRQ